MNIKSEFKKEKIKILIMVILLAGACFLTYYFHTIVGKGTVFNHLFYIPIILSSVWWKRKGLVVTLFLVAILIFSHFLLSTGEEDINDLLRAPMLILISIITIFLTEKIVKVKDMLSEKNEYLEKLINHANAPIIVWDKEGSIIRFNTAFEDLTKYQSSELIGKHFTTIFNGRTEEKVLRKIEQTLKDEYLKSVEITILDKHGNELILLWNPANVYSSDGKNIIATIAQGTDITDIKRAEDKLKNYQTMVESAHDAIFFKDLKSRYIICNSKTIEAFGLSREKVIGKNDYEIMPNKEEAKENVKNDQLVFKTGKPEEIIKHMTGADGKEYWFQAVKVPQFDDKGNTIGLVGIARDITDIKRAEAVVKKERNFSANVIATVPDSLVVVDKDLKIKSANRSFYEIFQMEPENVIGASITEILGDKDGELSTELLNLFGTEDILDGFELQYQSKELGKRILNLIVRTIIIAEEEEEEEELIVLQDITERKQAEETLQRFNEELEQKVTERTVELDKKIKESEQQRITTVNIANDLEETNVKLLSEITERKQAEEELKKHRDHLEELVKERTEELEEVHEQLIRKERLAVLGQLSGGVAHELRNPLGVISNSIYYLNMKLKDKDEKVKKHLALLKREIKRSDNMIIELLDFSKVKLLYITETNVNTLIKETIEEIKIPEQIDLEMDLDEKIPQLQLDPDKMQLVFQNIISNALQSMPEKGKLHIKTSSNDDFTEISFSDNGSGITEENLKKMFEPLVTTKVTGIGLGLAIVKNIIDYHKGKIDVKSEVGKGTTFTIKLRNYEKRGTSCGLRGTK
ncbi:MAG: PAS domain S-box protein [Candidatus Cloacimonetes bacterium]|jgi:PAS domain S-box-containing protein|nr:PAS domain S-box protein [Candidatus Cloacimonadota bacterium]